MLGADADKDQEIHVWASCATAANCIGLGDIARIWYKGRFAGAGFLPR